MRVRNVAAALFVVVMTATCVRLGFWQLSRLREKQALNAALRSALARPPLWITGIETPVDSVRGRRVELRGVYDERRQILLAGRAHDGAPGVSVVTPLLVDPGHAVLVERGWLYSDDASTAHPERDPEPGTHVVIGMAAPFPVGRRGPSWRQVASDSATLWSTRWLDPDSLAARLPYAVAGFAVRQLPGAGVSPRPLRTPPAAYDEMMHVSYAVQWFLFAAILSGGSLILAFGRRRPVPTLVPPARPRDEAG